MTTRTGYTFLTKKEGAAYLGATERQISRWVQSGRLTHTRLGNRTLLTQDGLDAFVQSNTSPAVSP